MERFLISELYVFAIIVLSIMYFSSHAFNADTLDQKLFKAMIVSTSLILITDLTMLLIGGRTYPGATLIHRVATLLYYIFIPLIGYIWLFYCDVKLSHNSAPYTRRMLLSTVPLLLHTILAIHSIRTGWFYGFTAGNIYFRGRLFFISAILQYYYPVAATLLCIKETMQCSSYRRRDCIILSLFMAPPLIGSLIQVVCFGVNVIWICVVISLLIIYVNVQNGQISTDPLTGANNRRWFEQQFDWEKRNLKNDGLMFVIMIDIDDFKQINDSFGHAKGDEALVACTDELSKCIGKHRSYIVRMGGDEFVVFWIGSQASELSERMECIERHFAEYNTTADVKLNLSMGGAVYSGDSDESYDNVLMSADAEMYTVKRSHKTENSKKTAP